MHRILKIIPPTMPNYFQYEIPPSMRQDGFKLNHSIPISEFSEEEANEFANMMKSEFLKHWANKKNNL